MIFFCQIAIRDQPQLQGKNLTSLQIHSLHIYGDSRPLIDGIQGHTDFEPPTLSDWISRIKHILGSLTGYTINHIYREANWALSQTIQLITYAGKPAWKLTNCPKVLEGHMELRSSVI